MIPIYPAAELQQWDEFTIENTPISSDDLMEKAALACAKQLLVARHFSSVSIVCGTGNNGGDGLAMARILAKQGIQVTVHLLKLSENKSPGFETNLKRLPKDIQVITHENSASFQPSGDVLTDCIFGTGLSRPVAGWVGAIIEQMNQSAMFKVAIDIPSGLFVNDNWQNPSEQIFTADLTFSIGAYKMAFFHSDFYPYFGEVKFIPIDLLPEFKGQPIARLVSREDILLKSRPLFTYKNQFGFLTVVGGLEKMIGATILSAKAGFKTGCGYVGVISSAELITPLATQLPEAIYLGDHLGLNSTKSTAIAIGPGLGTSIISKELLRNSLHSNLPLVLDADALNILSTEPTLVDLLPPNTILTPHVGELHRLLGGQFRDEERLEKQRAYAKKHKVYVLQKGAYSKLACPNGEIYINSTGNPAMATAGMGDVLTGIIGAFLAQGLSPFQASINGMYCHGLAADKAVFQMGSRGILASDIINYLPKALNTI